MGGVPTLSEQWVGVAVGGRCWGIGLGGWGELLLVCKRNKNILKEKIKYTFHVLMCDLELRQKINTLKSKEYNMDFRKRIYKTWQKLKIAVLGGLRMEVTGSLVRILRH